MLRGALMMTNTCSQVCQSVLTCVERWADEG